MDDLSISRFWSKVQKSDACWLWTKGTTHGGYGRFTLPRNIGTVMAHRVSWELAFGPIAAGLKVLHRCDVRACVRPDHLRLGTQKDNIRDAVAKRRMHAQKVTHCPQKHDYKVHGFVNKRGQRQCRTCGNARRRKSSNSSL